MKKKDTNPKPIPENQNNRQSLLPTEQETAAAQEVTSDQAALAETEVLEKIAPTDQMPIVSDDVPTSQRPTDQMPVVSEAVKTQADQQPKAVPTPTNNLETPEKPVRPEPSSELPAEMLPHSVAPHLSKQHPRPAERPASIDHPKPETLPGPEDHPHPPALPELNSHLSPDPAHYCCCAQAYPVKPGHHLPPHPHAHPHPDRPEGKLRSAWAGLSKPGKRWVKPTLLLASGVALFGVGLLTGSLISGGHSGPHDPHHLPPHLQRQAEGLDSKFDSRPGPEGRIPVAPGKPGDRDFGKQNSGQSGENPGLGEPNSSSDTKENQSGEPKQMAPNEPNTESNLPNREKENNSKNNKDDKNNN